MPLCRSNLSANQLDEAIFDEVPGLLEAVTVDPRLLAAYSSDASEGGKLYRMAVAAHEGVPFETVRATGSLLPEINLLPPLLDRQTLVTLDTDFAQYRRTQTARLNHVLIPVPLAKQEVEPAQFARAVYGQDRPIVFITMPRSNPAMTLVRYEAVEATLDANPDAYVVVDAAYVRFVDPDKQVDYARRVLQNPRVIFIQTGSKHLGLCSVKCGWLIANPDLLARLQHYPYVASGQSKAVVVNILRTPGLIDAITSVQKAALREMTAGLLALNLRIETSSETPWLLVDFGHDAKAIVKDLADAGIDVQPQAQFFPSLWSWVRVSATVPWQARVFVEAMTQIQSRYPNLPRAIETPTTYRMA